MSFIICTTNTTFDLEYIIIFCHLTTISKYKPLDSRRDTRNKSLLFLFLWLYNVFRRKSKNGFRDFISGGLVVVGNVVTQLSYSSL